ncbi:MAG: hypothetical protein RMJ03_01645 [Nitrososphaerota archaeon]|nr:hypothetical protein [Nitrososphaerota archaeon]
MGFTLMPKTLAAEYEGDGTYLLRVGDKIKASNGYVIELTLALGKLGSRSDWATVLVVLPSMEDIFSKIVLWGWGNWSRETDTLHIIVERYVADEAVITVISKHVTVPEFPQAFFASLAFFPIAVMFAIFIKWGKRCNP